MGKRSLPVFSRSEPTGKQVCPCHPTHVSVLRSTLQPGAPPFAAHEWGTKSIQVRRSTSKPLRECIGHRTALRIHLFFLSFLFFRFSFGVSWAFFCCSFLPLSLFPLSPISVSPCLNRSFPKGVCSAASPTRRIVTHQAGGANMDRHQGVRSEAGIPSIVPLSSGATSATRPSPSNLMMIASFVV